MSVREPIRPMSMVRMMMILPHIERFEVIPVENPQFPNAETTSKIMLIKLNDASLINKIKVLAKIQRTASVTIAITLKI